MGRYGRGQRPGVECVPMIRHLFICVIKDDPDKKERLATRLWADNYEVLCCGQWKKYKECDLEKFRTARRREHE